MSATVSHQMLSLPKDSMANLTGILGDSLPRIARALDLGHSELIRRQLAMRDFTFTELQWLIYCGD